MSALAITFDDGPDPTWTPKLLDRLGRLDARATFFPIAARAAAHPDLIARMIGEGHAVGLHCYEHVRHSTRDIDWLREDTHVALASLAEVGVTPIFWRTPYGDTAAWSPRVAHENGLRLVGWTADSHDWRGDEAAEMFRATQELLEDGAIVLAHDGIGPGATRSGISETLAYVELVAAYARRRGLTLEALA